MKDAPEVPGDFDMILQNAEGVKNKSIFRIQMLSKKQCYSR
jgi:hypothetical protein